MRNLVSDADKLDAIDVNAVERMIHYSLSSSCDEHRVLDKKFFEDLIEHMREHAEEKLLILVDQKYIRTKSGVEQARALEGKLKEILKDDQLLTEKIV